LRSCRLQLETVAGKLQEKPCNSGVVAVYTYVLRILKEQREEVKRRVPQGFAEQDIKYTADSFESARPLWRTPLEEVREIVKDRLRRLTDGRITHSP